jgi:hypothetical protein
MILTPLDFKKASAFKDPSNGKEESKRLPRICIVTFFSPLQAKAHASSPDTYTPTTPPPTTSIFYAPVTA